MSNAHECIRYLRNIWAYVFRKSRRVENVYRRFGSLSTTDVISLTENEKSISRYRAYAAENQYPLY